MPVCQLNKAKESKTENFNLLNFTLIHKIAFKMSRKNKFPHPNVSLEKALLKKMFILKDTFAEKKRVLWILVFMCCK